MKQPPPVPPDPPSPSLAPETPLGQDAGMRLVLPVGRSIWAIIAGYLGLLAILVVPAPLALLTGIIAVIDIRKSRHSAEPKHGMGRAVFGIVMGLLFTATLVLVLLSRD
ncbi:MAG: DUF4190 domain-containing protein [Akkermansiaceae bacterium]|nr:DUF4190 domain-containing protein [Akkermansiaceae bacterium]